MFCLVTIQVSSQLSHTITFIQFQTVTTGGRRSQKMYSSRQLLEAKKSLNYLVMSIHTAKQRQTELVMELIQHKLMETW